MRFAILLTAMLCVVQLHAASFGEDVAFMRKHTKVIVLSSADGQAKVAVVPAYQGRVMTSTTGGDAGPSFGWINRELIASGEVRKHINVYGGEDRFWLGPEGGQYAIFFAPGTKFTLDDWQTPKAIDTMAYPVTSQDDAQVSFAATFDLKNYSGTSFTVGVDRKISLLDRTMVSKDLGVGIDQGLGVVAYESHNTLKNAGKQDWTKQGGLLSIWILGMYKHSPRTTVVIPFKTGDDKGPIVNDAYFGKVPDERLHVDKDKGVLYFSGDGALRSKIGVGPKRAKPILGSWDSDNKLLTIVTYTLPAGASDYVNSMWEHQKEPYAGDVVNSYNDGPPKPGAKALGPFYELESSSPALELKASGKATHVHRTIHLTGERAALDGIAQKLFGVGLEEIEAALK